MFRTRPDSADEQAHIRSLTTAIGVQLIENQESDLVVDGLSQSSLPATREQQLQHHVICEENVRRFSFQFVTAGFVFLPCKFCKANGKFFAARFLIIFGVTPEFLLLRIHQRVQRINDHCRHPVRHGGSRLEQVVENSGDVSE